MTGGRARFAAVVMMALGLSATRVRAQSDLTVGVRVGVAFNTVEFEELATDAQTDVRPGLAADVTLARRVGRYFSVATGLAMTQEGFGGGGAHTGDLRRLSVGMPFLVSVRTPSSTEVHLSVGLAPKLALRCAQAAPDLDGSVSCNDPLMGGGWERFDVAALGAVGVAVPAWGRVLSADLALSWGLRDIGGSDLIPGSARAVGVGIMVGMRAPAWFGGQGGGR